MTTLAKINEVLFENSESIPNGLYVELMNLTKDLFNELPEPIVKWKTLIKIKNIKTYRLSLIRHFGLSHLTKRIQLVEECRFSMPDSIAVGGYIELLAFGDNKVFWEIKKINKCSIIIEERFYIQNRLSNNEEYRLVKQEKKIKIAEKYEPNENGIIYNCLLSKDIRFLYLKQSEIIERLLDCNEHTDNLN